METLIKAASDFLAAILSTLGFIGRPRRRAGIRDDLDLLERLRSSPDFGPESAPHRFLTERVTLEVARLSGVELSRKEEDPLEWRRIGFDHWCSTGLLDFHARSRRLPLALGTTWKHLPR